MGIRIEADEFIAKPIIKTVTPSEINTLGAVENVTLIGSHFTELTKIKIDFGVISNFNYIDAETITFDVVLTNVPSTADLALKISASNQDGLENTYLNKLKIPSWIDLRLNGHIFNDGDIRTRDGISIIRTANGMAFTGSAPWASWVKFESLKWNRLTENKTLEIIYNSEETNYMMGVGADGTNEGSGAQFNQGDVMAYISTSGFWGLYGNNGNFGQTASNRNNVSIDKTKATKIIFYNNAEQGSLVEIYELPSTNINDWGDKSNLKVSMNISGTMGANHDTLMPFIIPKDSSASNLLGLRIT